MKNKYQLLKDLDNNKEDVGFAILLLDENKCGTKEIIEEGILFNSEFLLQKRVDLIFKSFNYLLKKLAKHGMIKINYPIRLKGCLLKSSKIRSHTNTQIKNDCECKFHNEYIAFSNQPANINKDFIFYLKNDEDYLIYNNGQVDSTNFSFDNDTEKIELYINKKLLKSWPRYPWKAIQYYYNEFFNFNTENK